MLLLQKKLMISSCLWKIKILIAIMVLQKIIISSYIPNSYNKKHEYSILKFLSRHIDLTFAASNVVRVRDDTFFRDLRSLSIILPNHDLRSLTIIVWKSEEKVSTITHDHDRRSFPDHLNMSNMAFHNINSIKTWQNMKMNKILRLFTKTHFNFNNFHG